ncbi:Gfo/Idh/MocA family protein [Variovorax sp. OV329]|uniref:Gfo/Idh/MocA family protein n=1 Tax=Variovorax sp. OV329 TaxID=1882825 RepID=UPI0008E6B23B|nr:Gfo/Idh/MocA family oxidoreductase [Variovorax sp. OV329]SFM78181.1 Oxidoreductase family, NAD-binding Rossmann fold [Variovorax sp. OV329]
MRLTADTFEQPLASAADMPSGLAHAIVGLGRFGSTHARKMTALPGFSLRAAVDPHAEMPAELDGLPLLRHLDQLPKDIESATVATSDATHAEVAIALMARGCHVLVEKPMCLAPDDGARMLQAASQHGRHLYVGHVERFNPAFDEGTLAKLRSAVQRGRGSSEACLRFRRASCRQGPPLDCVLDLMVHDLDLMAWLCLLPIDEPLELLERRVDEQGVHARIRLGGWVAQLDAGYGAPTPMASMGVRVHGAWQQLDLRLPTTGHPPSSDDALSRQYAALRLAIRGGASRIASGPEGLAAVLRARQILLA